MQAAGLGEAEVKKHDSVPDSWPPRGLLPEIAGSARG
jgi:hypothetical protein